MLKHIILATAMTVAVPAVAQTAQTSPQGAAPTGEIVASGIQTPGDPSATAPSTSPAPATEAASTDAQQPAAGGDQVAQVVGREFGTYDKDGDGSLNQTEFSAWMVALRTASDPATKADAPDTRKWVGAAFAQADKDKSKSLTQAELTGFLSQGQS